MFRNQYDTDVTTWSPAGRLFQVEYAMEAVKQGSAAIGLRSKNHVVLGCVNKAQSDLSSHQRKIFKVDDHIGVAIAGPTADGRVLSRYMRSECSKFRFTYESPLYVGRLVVQLADKAQVCTQRSWKRPYGVGEKLKSSVCTLAVVGVGEPFHILDQQKVQESINSFGIAEEEGPAAEPDVAPNQGEGAPAAGQSAAPMDL
ncbi:hypothetical protein Nepgr_009765 [Nepenthes gracilis]|uniref:Proteasome subunit alpha type n=1 Tax=Nepenthes gracilis TaxID=150966 RepID=A0AAD3SB36_NEPGR|nr:hypothetical protein Nepgr_009765 [Nepenthes gracilis]